MPKQSMKLGFLANTTAVNSRLKALPLHQIESVIVFGTAVQKTKIIDKMKPNAGSLSLGFNTYHLIESVFYHTDPLQRAEFAFFMRRHIRNIACSKHGVAVATAMLKTLPAKQKEEFALEMCGVGGEAASLDIVSLARHPQASRVIEQMMLYPASRSVIIDALSEAGKLPEAQGGLFNHSVGQHVVAALINTIQNKEDDLAVKMVDHIMNSEICRHELLIKPDSVVLAAIVSSVSVSEDSRRQAVEGLIAVYQGEITDEEREQTDNNNTDVKAQEEGEEEVTVISQRPAILNAIESSDEYRDAIFDGLVEVERLAEMSSSKGDAAVIAQLMTRGNHAQRAILLAACLQPEVQDNDNGSFDGSVVAAARHPYRSVVIRAAANFDNVLSEQQIKQLVDASSSEDLAASPQLAVVVQHLLRANSSQKAQLLATVYPHFGAWITHPVGSHVVQAALEGSDPNENVEINTLAFPPVSRKQLVDIVLDAFDTAIYDKFGTYVVQKAIAMSTEEQLKRFVDEFVALGAPPKYELSPNEAMRKAKRKRPHDEKGDDDEIEKEIPASWRLVGAFGAAMHQYACFSVAALLRHLRTFVDKTLIRKIMGPLKERVYQLSLSPQAGRVVLDAMMVVASKELRAAIKNVIYLKCENFLTGNEH